MGTRIGILNYGARIVSWITADRDGVSGEIILSYNKMEDYLEDSFYTGCTIGRFSNRIADGQFELNGNLYELSRNEAYHCLHGGQVGFDKIYWNIKERGNKLIASHLSPHLDMGFPGNMQLSIEFELNDKNELSINYEASSDLNTIVSLTNHSYFNLNNSLNIYEHKLWINAKSYLPVDAQLIPTGEIKEVEGSEFDFYNVSLNLGNCLASDQIQITLPGGYDHTFVLNGESAGMRKAAALYDPQSGRKIQLYTDAPGLQFYSGNYFGDQPAGSNGGFSKHCALALEPQAFPNAPNQANFPSAELEPGQIYRHRTKYKMSVD